MTTPNFVFPQMPPLKTLGLEEARAAIRDVVGAFSLPENFEKMNQARAIGLKRCGICLMPREHLC